MDNLNKKYTITLSDGTRIENLEMNGNNFVSDVKLSHELFKDKLYSVKISDGEKEELHSNMELIQLIEFDNKYLFIIQDIPKEKLDRLKLEADIAYLAMMTGVKL